MKQTSKSSFTTWKKPLNQQNSNQYLQLLNLFSFYNLAPVMIEVTNIIDYAKNLQRMVHELCKTLPKVCVPLQVFKKFEAQSQQKTQKIHKLSQSQKNLKIELKVYQQKNQELQLKLSQRQAQTSKEHQVPDALQRFIKLETQKERERERQGKSNQVSERYITEKIALGSQKKRLSLPYISSNSIHLPITQKSLLKQTRPSGSKQKKHAFVTIPGEGSQLLIQHLMNKAGLNK